MAYFINDFSFLNSALYKSLTNKLKKDPKFYDDGYKKLKKAINKLDGSIDGEITIRTILDIFIPSGFYFRAKTFEMCDIFSLREILKNFNLMFLPLGNPKNISIDNTIDLIAYFDIEKEAGIDELLEYALKLGNNKPDPQMLEKARIAQNFCKLLHVFNELYYITDDKSFLTYEQIIFLEKLIFSSKITQSMRDFLYKALDSVRGVPLFKNYLGDDNNSYLREATDKNLRDGIDLILAELAAYGNVHRKFATHYRQEEIKAKFFDIYREPIYHYMSKKPRYNEFEYSLMHIEQAQSNNIIEILLSISCIQYPNLADTTNLKNAHEEFEQLFDIVSDYRSEHSTLETFDHFEETCRTLLTKYKFYNPDEIIFHDDNEELIAANQKLNSPFLYGTNLINFFTYPYLFNLAPMDGKNIITGDELEELYKYNLASLSNLYNDNYSFISNDNAENAYFENIAYRIFVECYLNEDLRKEADKAFSKLMDHFITMLDAIGTRDNKTFQLISKFISVYVFLNYDRIKEESLEIILNAPQALFLSEFLIRAMIDKEINFDEKLITKCFYQIIISKYVTHHEYPNSYSIDNFPTYQNPILLNLFKNNKGIEEILWGNHNEISDALNNLETYCPNFERDEYSYYGRFNFFIDSYDYTYRQKNSITQDLAQYASINLLEVYINNFIAPSLRLINADDFSTNKQLKNLNEKFTLIGKYLEKYSHAISEFAHIAIEATNYDEIKSLLNIIHNHDFTSKKALEIKEFHLKNSPISFKNLKDFWKLNLRSKFNNYKITCDIATLFNFYAIPNNQVEDPSYMPVSSFGGFIFLEKPLFIPDFLFEKIKAYRYALEAALELKTINYLKEIFLYKVVPLIKKKMPAKKMAQEIEIFTKLHNIDFKAQCKEYRNEINNLINLDAVPARKELKDDYEFFIYFNLLKYIDSINLIKTKFKTKLQFAAKEGVVYLGKDEILDLKDYVQIILKYDQLKKNEAQNERVMELSSKINQDNKKIIYFDKDGREKTKKLRNYSDIIALFEPNQDEIIIPSLVAKKNLNFKDIDEKIKETKEVHDILIPIFTDKNEITPVVPVVSDPVKEKEKTKAKTTKTKAKTKTTKKDELANTQDSEALEDAANSNSPLNKLSKDLQAIIKKISSLDEFTFEEFEKICKEHKIMANGAIDTINSWAYEEFDAPLLEIDTPMFFDKELLENLEIK